MQIQQGQDLRYLWRTAHVGRDDHALEPSSVSVLIYPAVVDPRSPHLHGSGSQQNLPLPGIAVARHQGAAAFVALASGCIEVFLYLGLQCLGEHPPRSGSGKLIEVEQTLLAGSLILM